jgi:hypothetical protein
MTEEFPLIEGANSWSCPGLGEWFQGKCRSNEWQSALIVYEKYKRSLNLDYQHLIALRDHLVTFSAQRTAMGKPAKKDFLTQEASAYCKRTWPKPPENID